MRRVVKCAVCLVVFPGYCNTGNCGICIGEGECWGGVNKEIVILKVGCVFRYGLCLSGYVTNRSDLTRFKS